MEIVLGKDVFINVDCNFDYRHYLSKVNNVSSVIVVAGCPINMFMALAGAKWLLSDLF